MLLSQNLMLQRCLLLLLLLLLLVQWVAKKSQFVAGFQVHRTE
jgi:hypothetical protein